MKFIVPLLAAATQAAIVKDGLWTGHDWYDEEARIGVVNGVPYSNDIDRQRQLDSPLSFDGSIEDYMARENVQRVARLFSEEDWERGFPQANPVYSRDQFLKAIAKFPHFCNENNLPGWSTDDVCRRELATIFAHWTQETGKRHPADGEFWTQGLYWVREIARGDYKDNGWSKDAWPHYPDQQYYGRGPMQLSWNYNYGQFSNIFGISEYNSKLKLLKDPDMVAREGYVAMAAGIWFYMTPQDPKPSMHDVMTGNFHPNAVDKANNITASFATTTNILNGGLECGPNTWDAKRKSRAEYFRRWLEFVGLPEEDDLDCGTQPNRLPFGGSGDVEMYFEPADEHGKCKIVSWMTQYSAAARDDYKRCVCDAHGKGEEDCPMDPGDTSKTWYQVDSALSAFEKAFVKLQKAAESLV